VAITGQQTLFNGFQTANRTRAAESAVLGARETLRVIEQTVLLDAATAYMNVLRDITISQVQRSNVRTLEETLRQTRDRFKHGEVTRTDIAQAQAQLATGQTQLLAAEATLAGSKAIYRRVIGSEPSRLTPGTPVDRLAPRVLAAAIAEGIAKNPSVTAAMYGVDVAALQVKIAEGALYPVVTLQGSVQRAHEPVFGASEQLSASILGGVTIPIYQGGCRILSHPPIKGDAGAAPARSRHDARSGARHRGPGLGSARGRQGADPGGAGTSNGFRVGAQRRS
jgi:outer membrane protein